MAHADTLEEIAVFLGRSLVGLRPVFAGGLADILFELGLDAASIPDLDTLAVRSGTIVAALDRLSAQVDLHGSNGAPGAGAAGSLELLAALSAALDSIRSFGSSFAALTPPAGVAPADFAQFADSLAVMLAERALIIELAEHLGLFGFLKLLGVIRTEPVAGLSPNLAPSTSPRRHLSLPTLPRLLSDPLAVLGELYGWGMPALDAGLFFDNVSDLFEALRLSPVRTTFGAPPRPALGLVFLATLVGRDAAGGDPAGLEVVVESDLRGNFDLSYPIGGQTSVELRTRLRLDADLAVAVVPPASLHVVAGAAGNGSLQLGLVQRPAADAERLMLLGAPGGSRLEASEISVGGVARLAVDPLSGQGAGEFGVEGRLSGGKFVISLAEADGFVGSLMQGFGLEGGFETSFGWRAGGGPYFTGSGGLELRAPTHIDLGPVAIDALTLALGISSSGLLVEISVGIRGKLGPITAAVERVGVEAVLGLRSDHSGALGPVDLAFRFKPPDGVGLALDVGIVKGGGYLHIDVPRGEYAGALELVFADFLSVAAVGLITTKNPDGSQGFSLLVVITADFIGGIQLGFGFTLLSVGGVLGLNRGMNLEALTLGVRTGAVESVMFPRDVVANAPRIISDLRTFFPVRAGTFLIGPMVKLGWGTPTLISASVGIIVEIPGNVAIVGVLKVMLPSPEAALVKLQVNFAGAIEFDKKRLFFFAALFDSRILFMTLEGEMGLLVAWGDEPSFVVSVGGFHPSFTPPPLPFPSPKRIVVSILDSDWARIRVTNYLAVTSNTVQFGASTEMYFGFSAISVEGHLSFDALFQLSPFHFIVEISGSIALKIFGMGVFCISLHFALEGTSPWRARGEGSISFFFFEVSADFDITWGEPKDTQLDPVDVLPLLEAELSKPESWRALKPAGASDKQVILRVLADGTGEQPLVLHPLGTLEVRQRAVPLDLTFGKLGSKAARDVNRVSLAATAGFVKCADVTEPFALAQYQTMDDAAKLSRPSFERQHAGIELTSTGVAPGTARTVHRVVRYEETVIDDAFRLRRRRFRPIMAPMFDHFLAGTSAALVAQSQTEAKLKDPHGDAVKAVASVGYVVASTVDNSRITQTFASEASALDHLRALALTDPNAAAAAHVIASDEVVA
jgi:uncharacterized protein DUF6603